MNKLKLLMDSLTDEQIVFLGHRMSENLEQTIVKMYTEVVNRPDNLTVKQLKSAIAIAVLQFHTEK